MKYVFEDGDTAKLSKLFKEAYGLRGKADICNAGGSGNLFGYTCRLIKENPEENIVVFIDTIYDNKATIDAYNALATYAHYLKVQNRVQLIVIPIVCAEYYFIKSLASFGLIRTDTPEYLALCGRIPWQNALKPDDIANGKLSSFEHFCKWYLNNLIPGCAHGSLFQRSDGLDSYTYYTHNCPCGYECEHTIEISLTAKALEFVMQYPCYPRGVTELKGTSHTVLGIDDMVALNHTLCEKINSQIAYKGRALPLFSSTPTQLEKKVRTYKIIRKISRA